MRNYKYSKSSLSKIHGVDMALKAICYKAIEIANSRKMHCPDFGISCGFRTTIEQTNLYAKGRESVGVIITNADGIINKSAHQTGLAIDFFAYVDGKANYEDANMALIATCFMEAAARLNTKITWGGNFYSFSDGGHIEMQL